jgi:hypothetical protein
MCIVYLQSVDSPLPVQLCLLVCTLFCGALDLLNSCTLDAISVRLTALHCSSCAVVLGDLLFLAASVLLLLLLFLVFFFLLFRLLHVSAPQAYL